MNGVGSLLLFASLAATTATDEFDPFVAATPVTAEDFGPESDGDYDGRPDGWTRRSGPGFPNYIDVRIDRREGRSAPGSLRMAPDGSPAATYGTPVQIEAGHLYVFEAFVRTQKLKGDAAVCSVSILDERMQRIGRHLTTPVSGTHRDWVRLRIGPIEPVEGQRFLVVGCHLVRGDEIDLEGGAWFDDLRLGRTPRLSLEGRGVPFLRPDEATTLGIAATGLEPETPYHLSLLLRNAAGIELDRKDRELGVLATSDDPGGSEPLMTPWEVPGASRGFYRVEVHLRTDGRTVARRDATFVVTDAGPSGDGSPFGWSVGALPARISPEAFARASAEAGLGWVKLPIWRDAINRVTGSRTVEYLERLTDRNLAVVGVLDPPPDELRQKFAKDWSGAGELYSLSQTTWTPSLEVVIARYGARVRHWQLGRDGDGSFAGITDLRGTLGAVRETFDRVGRNTQIGLPWSFDRQPPTLTGGFVSILQTGMPPFAVASAGSAETWAVLRPLSADGHDAATRAADLVRRVVAARVAGASAVFVAEAVDAQSGLLSPDGSPTELFLPWRTTVIALHDLEDLGPVALPTGSHSRAFTSGEDATIVLWSDEPVTEVFTPGGSPSVSDVWGNAAPFSADSTTGRVELAVGPSPLFLTGASAGLLRWQIAAALEREELPSQHGAQQQSVVGVNPFGHGVSGTVTVTAPAGWEVEPKRFQLRLATGEAFRFPFTVTLPPGASLGRHPVDLEFDLQADRPYQFAVRREVAVGSGDVAMEVVCSPLPDGRLEVVQTLTNQTDPPETLSFRCDLFVPGEQRQRRYVVRLGSGRDTKRYYLSDAAGLVGRELRLRAEEENGRRVLNYRWTIGEDE